MRRDVTLTESGLAAAIVLACGIPLIAQQASPARAVLTADDYARAERFMGYNATPLVVGMPGRPTWLADDRFWYRATVPGGAEFVLVDPARAVREPAFDHARSRRRSLSAAARESYTAPTLPFTEFDFSADARSIEFEAAKRRWRCDRQGSACTSLGAAAGARGFRRPRPSRTDGSVRRTAPARPFVRNYNLWVRDVASGRETQLTTDGVKDFAYATNDAGWTRSDTPVVVWSPDSKQIATFRHDARGVGEMYYVNTVVGHPTADDAQVPAAGDDKIFMIERVIIDVDQKKVTRLKLPSDPHRSTLCDHVVCGGTWADVQWSPDSTRGRVRLHVARSQARGPARRRRGDRRGAQRAGGAGRDVLRIRAGTRQLALSAGREGSAVVLAQGRLGPPLPARRRHRVAEEPHHHRRRQRHAGAARRRERADDLLPGRRQERGRDPYYRHLYRIAFDGSGAKSC